LGVLTIPDFLFLFPNNALNLTTQKISLIVQSHISVFFLIHSSPEKKDIQYIFCAHYFDSVSLCYKIMGK
jgi:hypothetical protein